MEEAHPLGEPQEEEDRLLEEILEEDEAEEDPHMDILFQEEDKHHRPVMANL